ncbi:MAG: hypothetical protein ACRCYO_10680 [Bacteroidia bacterium]
MYLRSITLFVLFSCCVFSCKKEKQQGVPYVYVNKTIYVTDPQYINLATVGGWVYLDGHGLRGLLLYRKSQNEIIAYDRACPVDAENPDERVRVDSSNVIVEDGNCGSKFLLSDGSTIQNPALVPLKMYRTSFDGTTLVIFN